MTRQTAHLLNQSRLISLKFVQIELDLAVTFCEVALATENDDKVRRNLEHAYRAYESATRFAKQIHMNVETFQKRLDISQLVALLAKVEDSLRV